MNNLFNKLLLRVDLDGDLVRKFQAIKKRMGLKNNTEVIRSLINQRYDELQPQEAELEVPEVRAE